MGDMLNRIVHGDCLVESEGIESGSVDLILTDLPYGTVKGLGGDIEKYAKLSQSDWDVAIEPVKIYEVANRILRKNGKMVLFSQEPYTTRLINEAIPNVPFSYRAVWEKDHFANCLVSKKAMVGYYEDVLVFSKTHAKHDFDGVHPLRPYFAEMQAFIGLTKKAIIDVIGQRADHCLRTNSTQFSLCTEATYDELITVFNIDRMDGFRTFADIKAEDVEYRSELIRQMNEDCPSVFNLWEGGKYKSNILRYKKDYNGYHPTQKPVLLLEDLIKTFSNEGDVVVDLTAGSGSTAVAAVNSGRNFVAIEQDWNYCLIANQRIEEARAKITQ